MSYERRIKMTNKSVFEQVIAYNEACDCNCSTCKYRYSKGKDAICSGIADQLMDLEIELIALETELIKLGNDSRERELKLMRVEETMVF